MEIRSTFGVPEYTIHGIKRYVEYGEQPGHFLTAVLTNNLHEAVNRGDNENQAALAGIVKILVNYAPSNCWGSVEKVQAYMKSVREKIFRTP